MHPLAISLVLLSAAMHALRNFFNKRALDKQAFVWWYEVFGLLFFTPVFLMALYREGTDTPVSITYIYNTEINQATHAKLNPGVNSHEDQ